MNFILFLVLNAMLFIRPGEVIPGAEGGQFYLLAILACAACSLPAVGGQLTPSSLLKQPLTACVLGMLGAIVLSHATSFAFWEARNGGYEFAKVVLYYLLLVGIITSGAQLQRFMLWLVAFIGVLAVLALLQYHGAVNIPALEVLEERGMDPETGEEILIPRLRSTGIFNDPNDLCLILVLGMGICLYRLGAPQPWLQRGWFGLPLGVFGYALTLTQSRGGFLALLTGLLVLFRSRFGWWKTAALSVVVVPLMFVLFAGRQTSIDTSDGTAQDRIQLWSEGLGLFRTAPLFGIGQGNYAEEVGLVAHNSYVHCYAELGFVGGTIFVGAFYVALHSLYRLGSSQTNILDPELRRLRPYLMAMVAAYAAGMWSLSRAYIVPTYLILGLVAIYLRVTPVYPPLPAWRVNSRLALRLSAVSVGSLVMIYLFVRVFAHFE